MGYIQQRENFNDVFIGANKSGKTTVAEMIAREWRASKPDNHMVVAFDPTRRIQDITDISIEPEDDDWAMRCCKLRNCLIFLDEFRLLNEQNTPVKGLKGLLQMHTNYNIDIISVFHNPGLVLNAFTYHAQRYFIFHTHTQEGSFQKKIPNYLLCTTAAEQVNEYVRVFGRGDYPKFPFVVVNTTTQKLQAFNMEKKLRKIPLNNKKR